MASEPVAADTAAAVGTAAAAPAAAASTGAVKVCNCGQASAHLAATRNGAVQPRCRPRDPLPCSAGSPCSSRTTTRSTWSTTASPCSTRCGLAAHSACGRAVRRNPHARQHRPPRRPTPPLPPAAVPVASPPAARHDRRPRGQAGRGYPDRLPRLDATPPRRPQGAGGRGGGGRKQALWRQPQRQQRLAEVAALMPRLALLSPSWFLALPLRFNCFFLRAGRQRVRG